MTIERDQKRVSAAYRDVATETTPAALDRRILAAAEQPSRSRYGLLRTWMRPVAWAATIGLSLAFLLEMTWFAEQPPVPEPASPAVQEERARRDADVMKAKEDSLVRQTAPQRTSVPPPSAEAPAAKDESLELLEVGQQSGNAIAGATSARLTTSAMSVDAAHYCDDEARASAASWYACIKALREEGRDEEAAAELEALLDAHPDFEVAPVE